VFMSIASMSLNVLFSLAFSSVFSKIGWEPFGGLALANTIATAIEMIGLWILMRRRLDGIEGRFVWNGFVKSLLATLVMSLILLGWLTVTQRQSVWVIAVGGMLIGGIAYGLMCIILRVPEIYTISQIIHRKFTHTI
jgi:putative peptidoglycan lipid II flippase